MKRTAPTARRRRWSRFKACADSGITTLDTARSTATTWRKPLAGLADSRRDKIEIVTKCGIYIPCEFHPERKTAFYNAEAARIVKSTEKVAAVDKTTD